MNTYIYIGIGVGIFILLVLGIIILRRKSRRNLALKSEIPTDVLQQFNMAEEMIKQKSLNWQQGGEGKNGEVNPYSILWELAKQRGGQVETSGGRKYEPQETPGYIRAGGFDKQPEKFQPVGDRTIPTAAGERPEVERRNKPARFNPI